jgi:hypothetical protein
MSRQISHKDEALKSASINFQSEIKINSALELMMLSQDKIDMKTVEKIGVSRKTNTKSSFGSQ